MTKVSLQAFVKNWRALVPRKIAAKRKVNPSCLCVVVATANYRMLDRSKSNNLQPDA